MAITDMEATPEMEASPTAGMVPEQRYKDSVKAMNKAQQEAADLRKRVAELESTPEADSENMAMLREDFPELASALDELKSSFDKRLSKIEKSHGELSGNVSKRYWNELNRAVPDLKDFIETPEFNDWWAKQTPEIQAQLVSPDPTDVAEALKMYTADTGEVLEPDTEEMGEMESEGKAPNITAIELNVGKPKPDKMEMAKKMAAPNIKPSSGGKAETPFRVLSREETSRLSMPELMAYNKAFDNYMSKRK